MGLSGFERRLERMVEGVFARAFRSGLQPVELGRRLVRVMDAERTLDIQGRRIVPNHFVIRLGPDDHARFDDVADALVRELAGAAREHAREERLGFLGRVGVELVLDPSLRTGRFEIDPSFSETATGGTSPARLLLPDGREITLADAPVRIGRLPECAVTLNDPNVSREHAELVPSGDTYLVHDLGSTNGTRVNGIPVRRQVLVDGDEIVVGGTSLRFLLL
jgi:hypothetical protein